MQIALQRFNLNLLFCECFLLLGINFAKPGVMSHLFIALLHAQVGVAENLALENLICLLGENNLMCCARLSSMWVCEVIWVSPNFTFLFCRAMERNLVLFVAVKLEVGSSSEEVVVADDGFVFFANLV